MNIFSFIDSQSAKEDGYVFSAVGERVLTSGEREIPSRNAQQRRYHVMTSLKRGKNVSASCQKGADRATLFHFPRPSGEAD